MLIDNKLTHVKDSNSQSISKSEMAIAKNIFSTYKYIIEISYNEIPLLSMDEILEKYGHITDIVCKRILDLLKIEDNCENFSNICIIIQDENSKFNDVLGKFNLKQENILN